MSAHCATCGMQLAKPGEYHPDALCMLMKARGKEQEARVAIANVLADGCSDQQPLKYRVAVFLIQLGRGFAHVPANGAQKPRPITSGARFQGVRRALRGSFFGGSA